MNTTDDQKYGDEAKPESGSTPTDASRQTTESPSPSQSGNPSGYVSEDAYKGLQRAAERQKAKLEAELAEARKKAEELSTSLEETKLAVAEKEKLAKERDELNAGIQALQQEREKLAIQLQQQQIVLEKYPDLAPLANYIPHGVNLEEFQANAENFRKAVESYLSIRLRQESAGATPPIGGGNQGTDAGKTQRLWDKVYALAGIEGKEREFEEAYEELLRAINP